MENFAPGLRESIVGLTVSFRVIVFVLCVAGLILQLNAAHENGVELIRPIVRTAVVVGLVATLPSWFSLSEKLLLRIADTVEVDYTLHPMRAAVKLRESVALSDKPEFSLRRLGESFYTAFLYSAQKLVVMIGSLIQLPFLVLQYVLKLLCYLFLPVALGLFMIPALTGMATRYVQQTLAVLAWPIGFAVTELVAYHLMTAYATNLAVAYDLQPGEIDGASFGSLLGGLLAAIWLIVGTLGTPVVMQALFCSGTPMTGGGDSAKGQLQTMQQVLAAVKTLKTGGAAAPTLAAAVANKGGSAGGDAAGPGLRGSLPPPSPSPAPVATARSLPANDPSGDKAAASARAAHQLPKAVTTL